MSDILPFSQWSELNPTETDPVKQLKSFSDYVRQESWKNGTYNQSVEDELKSGIDQKLIEGGLLTETTTDEEKTAIRDGLTTMPKSNLDADARFVYDDIIKTGVYDTHPLPTGDQEILSSYVASRNLAERDKDPVMAAQADSYAEAVSGILANREIVNRAKKNALARGDVSAVSIEDNEGNRFVEVGPDADQEVIRKETESLIKRGALAVEDIPNLSLNFQDNGFGSSNAITRRARGFTEDLNTIVKGDEYLSDLINKEASSLTFREREAQQGLGESLLSGAQDLLGGVVSTLGGLVKEGNLSGAESAIKETMTRSANYRDELVTALKNNTALADTYSDSEIDRFADDYIKALKGPTYRTDKAGSGVATLSTGTPIIARELALRPDALESEMSSAGLTEAQKGFAREQREYLAEQSAPETVKFLSEMDSGFVDKLAKARESKISDRQFVEEWLSNDDNYNNLTNRAKALGMETVKAVGTLVVSIPALLGNKDSAETMVAMSKAGQEFSQYAEIFGDRFGVGQQLANIVPSVAVDLLASAGTGGAYFAAKTAASTAAKGVAKNVALKFAARNATKIVPQALGNAVSKIDDVAAIAARGVATETPSAVFKAVSKGLEKGLVGAGRFTDNLMSVGPATFLRSAGSTYASVYGQLPEDMTHEAKHEASIGYAVSAGLFTAALTAGMSSIGLGGTESLVTRNLDDLTFRQMSRLYSQTRRAAANVTDDMVKKVVRQQTSGAFKSLVRDHAEGFVSEGFEEGLDQAFQIMVEEAAMNKDTPIREIGKGVFDAFILGGLMGAGTTAIRQVTPTITADGRAQEAAKMERARTELYSGIAKKLTDANSPKTAEALATAFAEADATAAAAAATATQTDGTTEFFDPASLDTENLFEKWNPADETTGLMADFVGRKVHYAGQQGILKSDGKGNVYLEYTERKSAEQPTDGKSKKSKTKTKTKTSTDAKAKGTKVRIELGSSAQLAKGIIETPYTALRTKVDVGDVKAGSLVVKSGKVYYALPHIDDITAPPYIVRNNKGEPVGLGFTNVRMVGSNATRDNFMVSFDGPIYDAAKYYGIDFSELSTITQADNNAGQPRQTKEERQKEKEEAKAFRAILVEPDPETELSPLDVLIENYRGLDILADPDLEIEAIPLPELINLSESLDDVLNDAELDPELKKQLAAIHKQVKIARADTEGFVAIANSEYTPINGDESIEIVDNLPRDFKITDYGLIKIKYDGEELLVKPLSINKRTYKITVVIDGKRKSLPIAGTVDKNTFNEVMPEIKARAASQSVYSLPNLRRMTLDQLADATDVIDELRQLYINNAPVLVRLNRHQNNINRIVEQKEAQAKKQAEKEAAAAAKAAKASETKAAKTTKKEGKKVKAAEPEAEEQEPEKPKRTPKKATAAEKEEVLKNIAEDVEDDVEDDADEDVEAEPEDVEAEVEETPSGPLTDEEFAELTALGAALWIRGSIDKAISEQPDFRTAIIDAALTLAKKPQKVGDAPPLNVGTLKAAVKALVEEPSNKNKPKSKPKKAEKDPSVVSVEEESTEPEDEAAPAKPTAKKQVVGAVVKVGSGDNYQTPRFVLESLSKKNNLLNPLDSQSRDQVDMALVYAASLDKKGTVTLDKISAGNLPDVSKTSKINRDKAAASNAPIVLIKDGIGFKPHPDSINLARIQNAKKSGEDVQVLIVSKGTAKNNGEVRIENKIAKNKTVANKGRVLTEALNDVLSALDKKYPDGNGKSITLRDFIERMDRYTAKFEETEYNSKHRQAYEAAIEQASKDINVAAKKLQTAEREESGEFLAARERIRQAAEILTREIKPKTERVVSNVKYNTPELRPVFRSDQEKEEFDRMVEHGYPERDMGPFLGKDRTGLAGVDHPAEPKTYLTGKSIYLLEKIREMYPVLDWEGINAKSRAKTKPYSIKRLSKKVQYRKDPSAKYSQVPVVVDKNGSAVFTNDPIITAVQLSELGPVEIPDSMLKTRNPSIKIGVLDGVTYAVGVTDYNGRDVQDAAKQTGNVRLARLEKGTALMTAIGGLDALSRVAGSGVVRLLSVPNKRTKPQDIGEYLAQVTSHFENRIGKGNELTDVASKIVNDSIVQLAVETVELTIAHQLARKVAMSKQFSSRINEEVTEAQIDETPLTIFTRFSDLTTEDIETAITPDDVMKILSPKTRAPKVRTLTTNQNKFVRAYEATRDEANKLDSSLPSITGKKEIAKAKKEVAELRKYLLDNEAQYNRLLRDRDYLDRQNTIARQQFEANQQGATGSEISKADLAVMIEDYYPEVTADNKSNLLRGDARHNYVLKKFGVMMVRRMSDPSFATGPKPDKIIDSIASRYRASFAKSQTGVTHVSIETLLTTNTGGWSLSEANPEAGAVLDGVMSELEAIEDVMTSSASETLRGMLISTANNSPELKAQLVIFGQRLDRDLFSRISTETESEEIIDILGAVMSSPDNQAVVINRLSGLPRNPEGRKMLAILSMMGWAPDPMSVTGIRVPTAEEIENASDLNLDGDLREATRKEIADRLAKMREDNKRISEDSEAYAIAMKEALASKEGDEIRDLFARQDAYDRELKLLGDARFLAAQFTISEDEEKNEEREARVRNNRNAVKAKITQINNNLDSLETRIAKSQAFINGVSSESEVFDPAPRIEIVRDLLRQADEAYDAIVVPPPVEPKDKIFVSNYANRKSDRDDLEESLRLAKNIKRLKRNGNYDSEVARLGDLNSYVEDNKAEFDEKSEKLRVYNDLFSQKSKAKENRENISQELESLKRLAASPQLQEKLAEANKLRERLSQLEQQKSELEEKLRGDLSDQVFKDLSKTKKVRQFLDNSDKLKKAEEAVVKAQKLFDRRRAALAKQGFEGDELLQKLAKRQADLEVAKKRSIEISDSIGGQIQVASMNEDARVFVQRQLDALVGTETTSGEIALVQEELAKLSGATSKKVESARRIVASLEAQRESLLRSRKSFSELVELSQDLKNPNNRKLIKAVLKNIQERISQYSSLNSNASAKVNQIVTDGFMVATGKITNPNQIRSQASVVTQRNTFRATNPTIQRATEVAKTTDQLLIDAQSKQRQAAARLRDAQKNLESISTALEAKPRKKQKEALEAQRASAIAEESSAKAEFDSANAEVTRLNRLKAAAIAASRPLMSMSADDLVKSSVSKLANEAEIKKLGLTESPIAALENIAKSGPPHLRLLAKMILRNRDAIDGLTVVIARFDHRIAGLQTGDYVVINLDGHNGKGVADVLVHEVVHFLTRDILSDPEVAARVDELRDLAASRLIDIGEDVSDYLYALSSNEEFLSAIFTDQKLQEALDVTESGKERSLFQKIIDFILRVFKADNMQTKTAMRELIKLTQESIDDRVYGSRAADLRDARTVRLDRQTNERARGFIDRTLAQEDALFSVDVAEQADQDNDLETRIRSQVPAGMTLVADTKLLGAMGVSDTGIIYYNPDLVAASVDGYDTEIADQMIGVMVTHEVAHAAANAVMTPQDYDDIATELGREELDRIADKYYSLTYPNVADRAAAMEEDRQNGDLDDRRIAAEFVRMEIEKAIVGSSSEDLLNRFVNKPSIVARIVEAIRGFINSMTRRQDRDFSLKIAADISRASRVMEELLNGGSLPASPEPHPTFGHAGELVDAATNGSHQMLYTMRIEEADKANKTASSIFSRLSKMASALPKEIDKFIKKREAELNANRLLLDRFAPQYRYYLEKALKNGANIDDVAKMFGSTSPTLDEATEAKISTQVENFRNSISNDDKGKSAKVRQFRERATLNAVKKNATAFRNEQNAAEARLNAISPEFVTLIKRFRAEIDKRQMAIGYDDESKGVYLTRTYKFFNTKGWAAAARNGGKYKVNGEVVDFDALREQASKIFEGQVRAEYSKEGKSLTNDTLRSEVFKRMDNLLATLETEAKKDKGESISQDTTRSLTKGPLDPALRQLLGETVNPFENAIRTFGYVSMLDVNKQALTSIRDALITTGYGVETEREGYVQVFGKGKSEALAPLAGLYVREDIAKELEAEFAGSAARLFNHNEKVMQQFGRGLAKMSGLSMTAKTLMGVGFFTRNAVTNQLILPLAQGILPNPVHAARSYKLSFLANFESRGRNASEEDIQEMMHLTRLGLMRDSSQRGTFDDLLRGFADRTGTTYESVVDNIVKAAQEADYKSLMGIAEQLKRYAGKGIDVLASLNGLMDDASKVQVFYFERAELKAAYPDMTDAELDEKASDKAKATMPGHIEQLDLVKKFNRSPFALQIFPFARWKTEVLRTLINTYKIGISEMLSGNPRMMFRGVRRLFGNSSIVLGGSTFGGSLLATIFSSLIDDEDEEKKGKSDDIDDEKVKAALRLALPAWQRGHTVSMSTNGRELRVVDMTAMMPYSTVSDSINIIKEGLRTGKGIDARGIADYWASQFVGSQIAAGAVADIARNKDDFDKNIYEESDTITAASLKVLNHIYTQAYEPSVVKKARQITREGEQERAAIIYGELLGARPVAYTLDRVASSGFYNLKDQIDSAKRLRSPLSSGRFISDEDFVNTMTEAQEYEDRVQSQMFQFTQALTTLGYDDRSIVLSATNTGSSKKRVKDAMSGINTAWSGGPDWRKTMTFNVEKGGEDDPDRRYELLRSTFESMPPMVDVTGQ